MMDSFCPELLTPMSAGRNEIVLFRTVETAGGDEHAGMQFLSLNVRWMRTGMIESVRLEFDAMYRVAWCPDSARRSSKAWLTCWYVCSRNI